jgi:hypothetical protein
VNSEPREANHDLQINFACAGAEHHLHSDYERSFPLDDLNISRSESGMSEKQSAKSEMSEVASMTAVAEAQTLIHRVVGPRGSDDSVKAMIAKAARRVGITYERAKAIWYREARVIRAEEMDRLRTLAAESPDEEAARNEFAELTARINRLECLLGTTDADFHGPQIAALRSLVVPSVGGVGASHRAVDRD